MKKTFTVKEKCGPCDGTGLYIGMAEHDGSAVVCHNCDGTGCHVFEHTYEDFEERKEIKRKVEQVFRINPGIGIGKGKDNKFALADFGGMPYADWLKGKPFPPKSEMRKYVCPAWWYQTVDYKKKPNWKECPGWGSFSDCPHFKNKGACWEKFDKENKSEK
jgi:hypothetical protein